MKTRLIFSVGLAVLLALMVFSVPAQAALPANLSWIKAASNPVVSNTLCYSGEHLDPALVVESANNYKMYFSDRSTGADIYLATTTDGGLNWTCGNSGNPVLTNGSGGAWDETRVVSATVVKDGASDYKMWYAGVNAAGIYAIGYATSSDGVNWNKDGSNPVLTKGAPSAWDSQYVREPSVINVGGTYHMWYAGTAKWPYFRVGHATSPDGINWTKDAGNPVLTPTAGTWDANEVYAPSVVANGSDYEMFYSGNAGGRWVTGHATASNANGPWTKDANAIITLDATGWEAGGDSADYVGALLDGTTWKVFYSSGTGGYRIGMATLTNQAQLTFNQLVGSLTVGATKVVTIDLNNVTDLYAYQFQVNYDATKVSAVGAFVNTFVDSTTNAAAPGTWNATCAAGVCKFAVTKLLPATPISGSGTIAQITFTGVAAGDSQLTFSDDFLTKLGAEPITYGKTTGFLTVFGSATVTGTVQMQGRTFPTDGGSVTVYDKYGYAPPTTVSFSGTDGTFSATVLLDPGSTVFVVEASHSLYLSNRTGDITLSNGGTYNAGTTLLKGGDANNDGKVDLADITCIGARFGLSGAVCGATGNSDITNNGIVNIFDLVLGGGNYERSSPQSW